MAEKLLNSLKDIGYDGPLLSKDNLEAALQEGPKSIEYTKLVNYLTNEMRPLLKIDEEVNVISSPEDSVAFVMEVGSILKELSCPYSILMQGHVSDRLQSIPDRLLLLDYLVTELMAARILQERKPDKKIELKLRETEEAANMRKILMTLKFPKPPPNITIPALFQKLVPTVQTAVEKAGKPLVGNPAFTGTLSDQQWDALGKLEQELNAEYKIRREMMLTRLDVTIQSFQWSDKTKGKDELINEVYSEKRKKLKSEPEVDISSLLAARDDVAIIEKTSNSSVRKNTQSALNKFIIGQVPDRGGRTSEQAPPPPEMPSWQQRSAGPGRGGGGRGGRGGGGGNFSQGRQNQNSGRGNYQSSSAFSSSNQEQATRSSFSNYGGGAASQQSYDNKNAGQVRSFDSAGSYGKGSYSGNNSSSYSTTSDNRGYSAGSYSGGNSSSYSASYSDNIKSYSTNAGGYSDNKSYSGNTGGYSDKKSYSSNSSGYSDNRSYSGSSGYSDNKSYSGSNSGYSGGSSGYSGSTGYSQGQNRSFDSAGSYEQNTKRPKTYDSFQSNKSTYSDQYVQDEQHNQQYRSGGSRGRGRSNYNRGSRNNY